MSATLSALMDALGAARSGVVLCCCHATSASKIAANPTATDGNERLLSLPNTRGRLTPAASLVLSGV